MTVVEEPAEGELIESVVVAVDVLVALRPAITIVTNFKRQEEVKMETFCNNNSAKNVTILRSRQEYKV